MFNIRFESEVKRIRFLTLQLDLLPGMHIINIEVGETIYHRMIKLE
ncbi:MAG: hypothetical protein ABJF11_08925 [Reichenbachiella sp.]